MDNPVAEILGYDEEYCYDYDDELHHFTVLTDYFTSERLLKELKELNPEAFDEFYIKFLSIKGIDKMHPHKRFRFIEFLLTSYIDWGASKSSLIPVESDEYAIILHEVLKSESPTILLDFQEMFYLIQNFNPPKEAVEEWGEIFGNALKHQAPLQEVNPDIATGAGQKKKSGRKRQDR